MSAFKGMPAPWKIDDLGWVVNEDESLAAVQYAGCGSHGADWDEVDLRLVLAAPEVFSALEGLLNRYIELVASGDAGNWDAETEDVVIAARAAIAKATGADE